jgi:hypothetical protein
LTSAAVLFSVIVECFVECATLAMRQVDAVGERQTVMLQVQ